MDPKTIVRLRPYHPSPAPGDPEDLSRYLNEELLKIANPLSAMSESWTPPLTAGLSIPTAPLIINNVPVPVTDWDTAVISPNAARAGVTLDRAAGTIQGNGDANVTYNLLASCFLTLQEDSISQNQSLILEIDTGSSVVVAATVWVASAQQEFFSVGASLVLPVTGDFVLSATLRLDGSGGTVLAYTGNLAIVLADTNTITLP